MGGDTKKKACCEAKKCIGRGKAAETKGISLTTVRVSDVSRMTKAPREKKKYVTVTGQGGLAYQF